MSIRDVGPFKYWTLSNLPLFLLAAPMLTIMMVSSVWALGSIRQTHNTPVHRSGTTTESMAVEQKPYRLLRSFAVSQFLLAVLASTSYHVQIITRLSSAYPVWYWWLASEIVKRGRDPASGIGVKRRRWSVGLIRWMILYAVIQGGLFASFLPPA